MSLKVYARIRSAPMAKLVLGGCCVSLLALLATPRSAHGQGTTAAGQTPSSDQIEEVVVTATKREQKLSEVGVSVSALSGETMRALALRETTDIVAHIPNLENASVFGPGTDTNFSIRGVAQNDFNDATESPIATYVDDVYFIPDGVGAFPLFDMERVEVLRGPQGTLFGRNSTAGAIQFISKKPTDNFLISTEFEYGSYNERQITEVVNVPIVADKLLLRIAGQYHDNDGWLDNPTHLQPSAGQIETADIRGFLTFRPTDDITDLVKASYDHAEGRTSGNFHQAVGADPKTGNTFLLPSNWNYYGTCPGCDSFGQPNYTGETAINSDRELKGAHSSILSNRLDWVINEVTVTAITAWNEYNRDTTEDCDGTPLSICATHYHEYSEQFSQELRAFGDEGGLRWTTGAYYISQYTHGLIMAPLLLNTPSGFAIYGQAQQSARGYAIFGNLEYDLTPELTLTGGLRGARDEKHINEFENYELSCPSNPGFAGYVDQPTGPFCGTIATSKFDDSNAHGLNNFTRDTWSGKLELDYKPMTDLLVYASVSRGAKAAGFNNGNYNLALTPDQFPIKSETLLAGEVGVKSTFWDRHANLNAAVFDYGYKNFQTLNYSGIGSFLTNNDARLVGGEMDLTLKPITGLTFQLSAGVVHSRLYGVANTFGIVATREMAVAPDWNVSGILRYEMPLFEGAGVLGLQAGFHARDRFYNSPTNDSATIVPSVVTADVRIDYADADDKYEMAFFIKNVTDQLVIGSVFNLQGLGGYRYGIYQPPLWAGIQLKYNFGG